MAICILAKCAFRRDCNTGDADGIVSVFARKYFAFIGKFVFFVFSRTVAWSAYDKKSIFLFFHYDDDFFGDGFAHFCRKKYRNARNFWVLFRFTFLSFCGFIHHKTPWRDGNGNASCDQYSHRFFSANFLCWAFFWGSLGRDILVYSSEKMTIFIIIIKNLHMEILFFHTFLRIFNNSFANFSFHCLAISWLHNQSQKIFFQKHLNFRIF